MSLQANYILEYACYHDHREVIQAILEILDSKSLNTHGQQRLDLYTLRQAIQDSAFPVDPQILELFCNLESSLKSRSLKCGVDETAWLQYRTGLTSLIVFSAVCEALGMNCTEIPTTANAIKVPTPFDYSMYVSDISEIINDTQLNFNYESIDWETFSNTMKRMCTVDVAKRVGKKTTLSPQKLSEMFNATPIDAVKEEVIQFLHDIESKVLGEPELRITYKNASKDISAGISHVSHHEDWSEANASTSGPYVNKEKSRTPLVAAVTSSAQKAVTNHRPEFSSPGGLATNRSQPITPLRQQHHQDVNVSKAVGNLQRKYAQQDPLDEAVFSIVKKRQSTHDEENTDRPVPAGKRRKVSASTSNATSAAPAKVASPVKVTALHASPSKSKKSIIGARPTGSKINFDEEDEDIGDYETDEEDAKPSRAMSLINHARNTIDDSNKRFGIPSGNLQGEVSRFHIGGASAAKKPAVVVSENFNRDAKKGTRNRIQWSAEEKLALKEGLSKYGIGGWKEMLLDVHIGSVFRNRTNVDLKDKYRTMLKSGEIQENEFLYSDTSRRGKSPVKSGSRTSSAVKSRRESRASFGEAYLNDEDDD